MTDLVPDELVEMRERKSPEIGEEVLARWADEGWYYRGKKHAKFQEYKFKSIVLMLFLYETQEDIIITALDNEFQRFKAIMPTLNYLIFDLQIVPTKLFVDRIL